MIVSLGLTKHEDVQRDKEEEDVKIESWKNKQLFTFYSRCNRWKNIKDKFVVERVTSVIQVKNPYGFKVTFITGHVFSVFLFISCFPFPYLNVVFLTYVERCENEKTDIYLMTEIKC